MNPTISIILPVYNVERYLRECLDSILNQTFTDFEVLLINDGSTDNSGIICEEYINLDKRFKVFHQDNKGVSAARNLGIENAKGEWICFVDSDDKVNVKYLDYFHGSNSDSDFLFMNINRLTNSEESKFIFYNYFSGDLNDFFKIHNLFPHLSSSCSKFFKTTILKNNKITFDINLKNYEDSMFNIEYIFKCDLFEYNNQGMYLYRNTPNSSSKKFPNIEMIRYYFFKIVRILEREKPSELVYLKIIAYPLNRYFMAIMLSKSKFLYKKRELEYLITNYKYELVKTFNHTKFFKIIRFLVKNDMITSIIILFFLRKLFRR